MFLPSITDETLDAPRCPSNASARGPRGERGSCRREMRSPNPRLPRPARRSSARLPEVPSAHPRSPRTEEEKTLRRAANVGNPVRGMAPPLVRAGTAAEAGRPAVFRGRFRGRSARSWAAASRIRQIRDVRASAGQKHVPRETKTASLARGHPTPVDPTRAPRPRHRPFKRIEAGIGCAAEVGR
ncbi:unnamed protein product [Rangifer tarandus platyrhynchus]|uniref:Uncharacterized protein n=2 Tax=Rangifer tarandus platyrhynchus TaxID=3082113 RepID=A0ACB0FLL9_RANTA|nr:unnamed protein product [Rangifer tarandus platyrhynchus]CAI9713974.1 unnamed protein product [Rangifer tarandus platyrhynchus]